MYWSFFFFSSRRRHTRCSRDWSSDVCSSDLDRLEERLGGWPIPLLVGIFYVRSHQLAVRLHNEVPGIVVPEHVQRPPEAAGPNGAPEGPAPPREPYAEAPPKAGGVSRIPPFK